ncbi:hypothetical protein ACFWWM_00305 [Streptomyces sp. NPDC058682]|uniref:hypothetical protein n=1 Tax=Streptomyces sp. NPDC058682 TaxID=3346596 RepID=UPI0036510941
MVSETRARPAQTGPERRYDVEELAALIDAGGFWNMAPEWVPRTGYLTDPPKAVLEDIMDALGSLR